MTTPLATTIIDALAKIQRHQNAQDAKSIQKLETNVQTLITSLEELTNLPAPDRSATLSDLTPHRLQLDQTIAEVAASSNKLKHKIMNTVKTANATKGYGQYMK